MAQEKWDEIYTKRFGGMWYPDEGLVRFVARSLRRRVGVDAYEEKRPVGKVLDAGCGHGRHLVFFAEQGFEIYGADISKDGLQVARAWLRKRGLTAYLQAGDLTKLPFRPETFDVVVSYGVLDHIHAGQAVEAMHEFGRVCTKGAYVYVTLRSTEDCEYGRGEKTERNTFVLQEGYEKGLIQHFYDLQDLSELLKGFRVLDIECHEESFPRSFSVDKAFLQSSRGFGGQVDLSNLGSFLKYSRWHIAAEKV
ncbi:MAG: class I SAM-dependent methyltransferase [Candidatus Bathyarchaeia archaeon]|jgi:SAM-dependent methyltransferase